MSDKEVIDLVKKVFAEIEEADSVDALKKICSVHSKDLQKHFVKEEKYPQIKFQITANEIEELDCIDTECCFKENLQDKISESGTLTKLLYALAWKNGDLPKIRHFIRGVKRAKENTNLVDNSDKDIKNSDAIVFREFGVFLTNPLQSLIIDQHVIRAFKIFSAKEGDDIAALRKFEAVNEENTVRKYYRWSDKFSEKFQNESSFAYYVDRIVFALGRAIKIKKQKDIPNPF